MQQETKIEVRDLIQNAQYEAAARLLKQQGDDPEARELFTKLSKYVRQQRAKQQEAAQAQMSEPVVQQAQVVVDVPQTTEEYLAFVRQLIVEKRYEEAEAILERMQNNPTAKDMLETLRGIMDVAGEKKKLVNEYSGRLTMERVGTNIMLSLILILIFRSTAGLVAAGVYWIYDLTIAPTGRLNIWHVGAAFVLSIGIALFVAALPFLTGAGA